MPYLVPRAVLEVRCRYVLDVHMRYQEDQTPRSGYSQYIAARLSRASAPQSFISHRHFAPRNWRYPHGVRQCVYSRTRRMQRAGPRGHTRTWRRGVRWMGKRCSFNHGRRCENVCETHFEFYQKKTGRPCHEDPPAVLSSCSPHAVVVLRNKSSGVFLYHAIPIRRHNFY